MCLHRPVQLHQQAPVPGRPHVLVKRNKHARHTSLDTVASGSSSSSDSSDTYATPTFESTTSKGISDKKTVALIQKYLVPQWLLRKTRKNENDQHAVKWEHEAYEDKDKTQSGESETETRPDDRTLDTNTSNTEGSGSDDELTVVEVRVSDEEDVVAEHIDWSDSSSESGSSEGYTSDELLEHFQLERLNREADMRLAQAAEIGRSYTPLPGSFNMDRGTSDLFTIEEGLEEEEGYEEDAQPGSEWDGASRLSTIEESLEEDEDYEEEDAAQLTNEWDEFAVRVFSASADEEYVDEEYEY